MIAKKNRSNLILIAACMPFMLACLYIERTFQVPEPKMEGNADTVIETLNGTDWVRLQSLASETYTEEDYAKPGTLKFTANVTNEKPVYFSYGWCATTEDILRQNFEHIGVKIFLNDAELGSDAVHTFVYSLTNGQFCGDVGILTYDWPAGEYQLKAVATFDAKINDGMSDYNPGDYVYEYNVTVGEPVGVPANP